MAEKNSVLLEVKDLKKYYPLTAGIIPRHIGDIKAVDGVSFCIKEGDSLGLVGESGCGKSTLGKTILRLEEPTEGKIIYSGTDITGLDKDALRQFRKETQMIFQNPEASLDPRMTIGQSICEPLVIHNIGDDKEREEILIQLLQQVGLEPNQANLYPHELSGGQKQRVGIARALALNPKFIIADEPVSALDVSIQAQILNLMLDIQKQRGLTYLFIAHDLSVIKYVAHRIGVMYLGRLVELAEKKELFLRPLHPYTEALLSSVPSVKTKDRKRILLPGEVPSPLNPPPGCRFHPRCPRIMPVCSAEDPALKEVSPGHLVACHVYG